MRFGAAQLRESIAKQGHSARLFAGRSATRAVQPKGKDLNDLKKNIGYQLETIRLLLPGTDSTAVNDLSRRLSDLESQMLELNTAARKLLEAMTSQMVANPNKSLSEKRDDIRKQGRFSEWIPLYMHLIRVFGNSAVHGNDPDKNKNPEIEKEDIEIGLICLSQVIDLWSGNLKANLSSSPIRG